ncbi:hypothetical protein FRB99_008054 [Tulasnella sp. 403]|nr:hypothetical protein FRB99_008054 [Tulasnella sp. 403]
MDRPLALHVSALSEPEYQAYTCIFNEVVPRDDGGQRPQSDGLGLDWEHKDVPVGEARGWIRGKYGVDAALLDKILRLFPTATSQPGSLKAPQFLAVLRLISHVQAGRDVDRSLVFTQAQHPLGLDLQRSSAAGEVPSTSPVLPPRSTSYPPPPIRQAVPDPSGGRRVSSEESPAPPKLDSNPFRRSLSQGPASAQASAYQASVGSSAAKTAQKASEGTLQQVKTWEIIKSSQPSGTSTLRDRARGEKSSDSSAATTIFSKISSSPPSTSSTSSVERVASARVPPPKPLIRSTTRSVSPAKVSPTKPAIEEEEEVVHLSSSQSQRPVSPDLDLSNSASRPVRSKSLHGTSSSSSPRPPVPTPPPRRRPESVQVSTSPFASSTSATVPSSAVSTASVASTTSHSPFSLSRRSSIQHPPRQSHSPTPPHPASASGQATPPQDPFTSFYTTMKHLPKATEHLFSGADLQKFASKAEGGLAPGRGYISHRLGGAEGERLVKKESDDEEDDPRRRLSAYSDAPTVDSDTPGMDINSEVTSAQPEWNPWEPMDRRPVSARTGSGTTITPSSQRQALQAELDMLKSQRVDGWSRLS